MSYIDVDFFDTKVCIVSDEARIRNLFANVVYGAVERADGKKGVVLATIPDNLDTDSKRTIYIIPNTVLDRLNIKHN